MGMGGVILIGGERNDHFADIHANASRKFGDRPGSLGRWGGCVFLYLGDPYCVDVVMGEDRHIAKRLVCRRGEFAAKVRCSTRSDFDEEWKEPESYVALPV